MGHVQLMLRNEYTLRHASVNVYILRRNGIAHVKNVAKFTSFFAVPQAIPQCHSAFYIHRASGAGKGGRGGGQPPPQYSPELVFGFVQIRCRRGGGGCGV